MVSNPISDGIVIFSALPFLPGLIWTCLAFGRSVRFWVTACHVHHVAELV